MRISALDEMAPAHVTDIMYVDDLLAPAASGAQTVSIFVGCEMFTHVWSTFQFGLYQNRCNGTHWFTVLSN